MTDTRLIDRLPMGRELIAALGTLAVVAVGVLLFADLDGGSERSYYPVESGTGEFARVQIGEPAPDFIIPTLEGGVFELAATAGSPVWINVWASWCPPCRSEMPDVDQIRRDEAENGLVFLALNFDEPVQDIVDYLDHTGYDFEIGMDPVGEFIQKYNVQGLPMHVFIGADGRVESIRVGGMTRDEMEDTARRLTSATASRLSTEETVAAP